MTQMPESPSENMPGRSPSRMKLVGERRVADAATPPAQPSLAQILGSNATPPTATATTTPNLTPDRTGFQQEYVHRAAWKAGLLGALNVATKILAVRLILFAAVLGAIALSFLVLRDPTYPALAVLGVYAGVVVVPLIWLTATR